MHPLQAAFVLFSRPFFIRLVFTEVHPLLLVFLFFFGEQLLLQCSLTAVSGSSIFIDTIEFLFPALLFWKPPCSCKTRKLDETLSNSRMLCQSREENQSVECTFMILSPLCCFLCGFHWVFAWSHIALTGEDTSHG